MNQLIGIIDNEEVTDADRQVEIRILSFLTYSKPFTQEIYKEVNPNYFTIPEVKDIIKWVLSFYEKNKIVPKGHLKDIINDKKLQFKRFNELHELVIEAIEDPNKESNLDPEYMLKTAREYLLSRQLYLSLNKSQVLLKEKRPTEAIQVIKDEFRKIKQDSSDIIVCNPLSVDEFNKTLNLLHSERQTLFKIPGPVGEFIGPIERASFISLLGPEKKGKTATLIGFAKYALLNRLKVSFISVGDASPHQLKLRLYGCFFKKAYNRRYFGKTVRFPVKDCLLSQSGHCGKNKVVVAPTLFYQYKTKYVPCTKFCKKWQPTLWYREEVAVPLSDFHTDSKSFAKRIGSKNWSNNLRTYVFGQWSKNIEDIKDILDDEEDKTQFIPDVLIIDYMDDLTFETGDGLREFRHRNAKLWGKTRAVSIDRNIAVITATQATRTAGSKDSIDGEDQSEDKRKGGYVTAMYGLNQTDAEKQDQILRLNCVYARDADFIPTRSVTLCQCHTLGQPWVFSFNTLATKAKKK
jgi:hypothetical protein